MSPVRLQAELTLSLGVRLSRTGNLYFGVHTMESKYEKGSRRSSFYQASCVFLWKPTRGSTQITRQACSAALERECNGSCRAVLEQRCKLLPPCARRHDESTSHDLDDLERTRASSMSALRPVRIATLDMYVALQCKSLLLSAS